MNPAHLQSLALHSGELSQVQIWARAGRGDVWLKTPSLVDYSIWYQVGQQYPQRCESLVAENASSYEVYPGVSLRMPEHFLCALALISPTLHSNNIDLYVKMDHPEFPLLNGSAWPWWELIIQAMMSFSSLPGIQQRLQRLLDPQEEFEPQDLGHSFDLKVSWRQTQLRWAFGVPLSLAELLQAPTFISWDQLQRVQSRGLLQGVHVSSGVVYEPSRIHQAAIANQAINWQLSPSTKGPVERIFCHHKMVDFIGDLAILSLNLPSQAMEVRDGGHYQHHQILKGIAHDIFRDSP